MNRLSGARRTQIIGALVEGNSIRSTERMTETHRDTIMRLVVEVGTGCAKLMDEQMRALPCRRIQVDEIWAYVGKKQRQVAKDDNKALVGDQWTFVAIEPETKLIPAFRVGMRTKPHAIAFMTDLSERLANRVQIRTDGHGAYLQCLASTFRRRVYAVAPEAAAQQTQEGRALCRWGDPGIGTLVRRGKQQEHHFDEQLVEAAARLISNRWRPNPTPTWITCVPSRRHQTLVPDFARRLARRLGLPFVECIQKVRDTEPQKTRANSFQQAQNLVGAFAADQATVRPGPVLLVDDMVDSKWTFTVTAALLRRAGSGLVYPFALADTSSEDND